MRKGAVASTLWLVMQRNYNALLFNAVSPSSYFYTNTFVTNKQKISTTNALKF